VGEHPSRIYLDNAATSWPKPPAVVDAITDFYQHHGSAAGRGQSTDAIHVDRSISQVRSRVASMFNANDASQVVFTFNGTDALNMAIRGVLREGDHVITTVLEHNSVLRPLSYLQEIGMIELTIIGIDSAGVVEMDRLEDEIVNNTKLICVSHVSNVLGTIQPIHEIGAFEKPSQCLFLVDGAQSAGHVQVDVQAIGCDLFACSGHKGLFGPLGTGILYVNDRAVEQIEPYRLGGTGSSSELTSQPHEMPFRLESGNLNVAGILGLGAGLEFIESQSISAIGSQLDQLMRHFLNFANQRDGIEVYSLKGEQSGAGVVSFQIDSMPPSDVANVLDSQFGIQVRAGLHCSPLVHKAIGSDKLGGTVRMSVGHFNTLQEMNAMIEAIIQLTSV
jgi:cysteine desulfurase family protein